MSPRFLSRAPAALLRVFVPRGMRLLAVAVVLAACGGGAAAPNCAVTTVAIAPNTASVALGDTLRLNATLSQTNCANLVTTWESGNPSIVSVSASGTVTGVAVGGPVQVTARAANVSGAASIVVTPLPIATIGLALTTPVIDEGQSATVTVTLRDARGNTLSGRALGWSSSNTGVASVDANGRVTGVSAGTAIITARDPASTSVSGTITITVRGVVATVVVAPSSTNLVVGTTVTLVATVRSVSGNAITDRTITWTSSSPTIAAVAATGVVTGVAIGGPVTMRATADGVSGTATVAVTLEPVATVTVAVASQSIPVGQTTQATATMRDAQNNVLSSRSVVWASSNATVATVTNAGLITALTVGTATITGTSEGRSGSAAITVTAAAIGAESRLGYALVDGATATTNPAFTQNASGGSVTVTALGTGHWRVRFQSLARATGQSDVALVTPAANAHCVIDNWSSAGTDMDVVVRCYSIPGFAPTTATSFSVMLVGNTVFQSRSAFVWANQPTIASYAPSAANAYTSAVSALGLTRVSTGSYEARLGIFPRPGGFGGPPEVTLVSTVANGGTTVHCESEGADIDLVSGLVYSDCRNTDNSFADAQYTSLVFSGGRSGKAWSFAYFAEDPLFNFAQFQKQSSGGAVTFGPVNPNGGRDVQMSVVAAGGKRSIQITPILNTDLGGGVTEWVSCGLGALSPSTGVYEVICRNSTGAIVISDFTIVVVE